MSTPASIAGHPIHAMLVPFPIGLWTFSVVCDVVYAATGSPAWSQAAYYTLGGGIVGAALAAVPGLIDGWSVRRGDVFRNVLTHMALNSLAVLVFITSFLSRSIEAPFGWSFAISLIGFVVVMIGGWFGGELVYVLGLGVERTSATESTHDVEVSTREAARREAEKIRRLA